MIYIELFIQKLELEAAAKKDIESVKESSKPSHSSQPNTMSDEKKADDTKQNEQTNQITVYVVQGRNLPKYDIGPNAKSDPYVKVIVGKKKYKTNKIRRELNPVWNEQFVTEKKGLFKEINKIDFEVFDYDKLSVDDFMGKCTLKTDQIPDTNYSTAVQWVKLKDKKGEQVIGKNGQESAIQVKIKYTLQAEDINIITHQAC